ncbi:MAG: tetratricopeptide repeat protein [Candidatus Krumholzibacteriia bacterium]
MLQKLKAFRGVILGIGGIVVLVLSITALGCGSDKTADDEGIIVRNPQQRVPVSTVTPPRSVDSVTAPILEPEADVASAPEPAKEVTYEDAEAAFHEARYDAAVELFTRYTDRKGENPWGHYMLGLSSWKAGDPVGAERAFGRALELDPRHVKSWLNAGRVLLDLGSPQDALARVERALELDPESNAGYRLQGRALHELGQTEEAVAAYRRAIQIDHEDAWSMNNLGLVLIRDERFDEALPALARAVELRGDVASFFNNLGMALERTGHFRAAEEAYRSAVTIDVSYEKAAANLGRIEAVLQDPTLEPVDLGVLARSFVDEIEGWSDTVVAVEPTESVEPDAVVIRERPESVETVTSGSDSTGDGLER